MKVASSRRHCKPMIVVAALLLPLCGSSREVQAADLDGNVAKICVAAKRAREAADFETVERKRKERWAAIVKAADDPAQADSPWVIGYKAIRDVDGDETMAAAELPDPGLLNRMDYKGACQRLRAAFQAIQRAGDGPFLGEVATRFFEVAQQARACFRDALIEGSAGSVATLAELEAMLSAAERLDPCCVLATPMLLYLKTPDPKEAFLRAELRDEFKNRQAKLVQLSHRLVLFSPDESPKAEHADDPVLPWHGAVELGKAQSLGHILAELEYASYLTPDQQLDVYLVPGKIIGGRDANSDPFILLYGRWIICRVTDKEGRPRVAQLFLNPKKQWDYRYLTVLYRKPTRAELSPLEQLVEDLPVRAAFSLGTEEFTIRDFPVEATERLIAGDVHLFCARDVLQFAKLRFSPTGNNPNAVSSLESAAAKQQDVRTLPAIKEKLEQFATANDRTKHPLVELMKEFNPLVIVSDDDRSQVQPAFFPNPDGDPYLLLADGARLSFDSADASDRAPCFYIEYPGATAVMPLQLASVPLNLLEAGRIGAAFRQLLLDAGYPDAAADVELRRCLDKPSYVPPLFEKMWKARVRSTRRPQSEVLRQMLGEKNWDGDVLFPREVQRLYSQYGFRYLRDRRSNWITSSRFSQDQGVRPDGQVVENAPDIEADIKNYPFDFRAQDGKQRVDRRQVYAWQDYEQLKRNIYVEHLAKLIRFQPCFPVWDLVMQDAMNRLENPSERQVDFSKTGNFQARFNAIQGIAARGDSLTEQKLVSPCGAWAQPDDRNQAATLDNLHNEYVTRIQAAAVDSREMELLVARYAWLNFIEERIPVLRSQVQIARNQLDNLFNQARVRWLKAVQPVFAVQLESARDFATQRYFHRSMVHYNDLLLQQYGSRFLQEGQDVLRGVASTQEAEKFATAFEVQVQAERLTLVAQVELAGVLNAAGLKESAFSIWRRLSDDYRHIVKPMVAIAEDTVMSYGLRFSDRATESLRAFEDIAGRAEAAIEKNGLAPQWRVVAEAEEPVKQRCEEAISAIERGIEREQAGQEPTAQEIRIFERGLDEIPRNGVPDLALWLRYRKALLPRGNMAMRPLREYRLHPVQFCPAVYSREHGFERHVSDLLGKADADAIRHWCGLDEAAWRQNALAPETCFLLGWYWLDVGNAARARAAFMGMVEALQSQAEGAADKQQSLVARLNAMGGLLGANSIVENVPGVAVIQGDFGVFLRGQVLRWEREWFAASLYGPHASAEGRALERQVEYFKKQVDKADAAWRSERYFFPDYTYVFGAVPDWLAKRAILTPELFDTELTKEDVANRKDRAADELGWVLLTEKHAEHFFDKLTVDLAVKSDIVDLEK